MNSRMGVDKQVTGVALIEITFVGDAGLLNVGNTKGIWNPVLQGFPNSPWRDDGCSVFGVQWHLQSGAKSLHCTPDTTDQR